MRPLPSPAPVFQRLRAAPLLAAMLLLATPLLGREVWHTTRPLVPGDLLRPQDILAAEPRRDDARFVDTARDITGLEVRRPIRANAPIPDRDIGQRPLVRSGQPVRVFWKTAGVTLEMHGKALESGAAGDEIRIHNPGSGRTLRGLVVAEGTAEIRGAP